MTLCEGGARITAWRITQHHQHLVGSLRHKVITCRDSTQHNGLERFIALPRNHRTVIVQCNGDATCVRTLDVGKTSLELIGQFAVIIQLKFLLIGFHDRTVFHADTHARSILVVYLYGLAREWHLIDYPLSLSSPTVLIHIAFEGMQFVSIATHLLINRIVKRIAHIALFINRVEWNVHLIAVQTLHLDALLTKRTVGMFRQFDDALALVFNLGTGHIFKHGICIQRVRLCGYRISGIDVGQTTECVVSLGRRNDDAFHRIAQRQQFSRPLTRLGVSQDGHLVLASSHIGCAVHSRCRGAEITLLVTFVVAHGGANSCLFSIDEALVGVSISQCQASLSDVGLAQS